MKACPVCKSPDLRTEARDNDHGDYTATICNACQWSSDTPIPRVAYGHEGNCELCGCPVRSGEVVCVWGDEVTVHENCPGAQA